MSPDCTRVVVRSPWCAPDDPDPETGGDADVAVPRARSGCRPGHELQPAPAPPARAQGAGHPHERDHLAGHDVGRAGRAARQPHAQPGRGPVRHGRVRRRWGRVSGRACSSATARWSGPPRPSRARRRATGSSPWSAGRAARRRPAGRPDPAPDQTHQGLTGPAGGGEAAPVGGEAPPPAPGRRRRLERRAGSAGQPERGHRGGEAVVEQREELAVLVGPRSPQRGEGGVALGDQGGVLARIGQVRRRPGAGRATPR